MAGWLLPGSASPSTPRRWPNQWPSWLPPTPSQLRREEAAREQAQREAAHRERFSLPSLTTGEHIPVSLSDRWYILGSPGCGKTVFAKRLAKELKQIYPTAHLYVLDSKGYGDFDGWPGQVLDEAPPAPLGPVPEGRGGGVQVWQPPQDDLSAYDAWLGNIRLARQPAIVIIDELSSLGKTTGTSYVPNLGRMLKQGRALRICPLILTQESAYIARQVPKMASQFVFFRLSADDRYGVEGAARLLGMAIPGRDDPNLEPRAKYGFWHRRLLPAPGVPVEYSGFREFFGEAA